MSQTLTQKLDTIKSIKADIKRAIESKGVTVDGAFGTYPRCIDSIETGGSDELAIGLIEGTISGDVIIPDGVTQIGPHAFMGCTEITSVTIPNSVTTIHDNAFESCSSMTSFTIPNSVTSIGSNVFNYCNGLTSVTIPDSVTSLGNTIFYSCSSLTSVRLPSGITSIPSSTFNSCYALTSFTIPSGVTSIGDNAFANCGSLTSVTIPNSVTSIEGGAFSTCAALTSFTIPSGVTSISGYTFTGCTSLASVTIPSGVTSIGGYSFSGCTALTSVTIPRAVTLIEEYAFADCSSLSSVTIENREEKLQYNTDIFANIAGDAILYVPKGLLSEYQADGDWSGAFSEIRAAAAKPFTGTITGVSASSSDPNDNTLALCANAQAVFGYANAIDVTFFGTGLSDDLDWEDIINVSYENSGYITNIEFSSVTDVAQDGTYATVMYSVSTNDNTYVTQYAENISFQWNETTLGTMDVSIFTVQSYEFTGGTDTINKYPNSMTANVRAYLPTGSGTDIYMNEKAQQYIANNILRDGDFTIQNTSADCGFGEQDSTIAWVDIQYSIQPWNESAMNVRLKWGDNGTAVSHTFAQAVRVNQFEIGNMQYDNGSEQQTCTTTTDENNSTVYNVPVGVTLTISLTNINSDASYFDSNVISLSIADDNNSYGSLSSSDYTIAQGSSPYVKFDTDLEWNTNALANYAGGICTCTLSINNYEQTVKVQLITDYTTLPMPQSITRLESVANHIDEYNEEYNSTDSRYVQTDLDIKITPDTYIEASIMPQQNCHEYCVLNNNGQGDDKSDWRIHVSYTNDPNNSEMKYMQLLHDYGYTQDEGNGSYGNRVMYEGNGINPQLQRIDLKIYATNIDVYDQNGDNISMTQSTFGSGVIPTWPTDDNGNNVVWNGITLFDNSKTVKWTAYELKISSAHPDSGHGFIVHHYVPVNDTNNVTHMFDLRTRKLYNFYSND